MRLTHHLAALALAATCGLVVAQPAHGKVGVRATLEDPARVAGAEAGERVTIAWALSSGPRMAVPDPSGLSAPEPFGASGIYVRIAGAGGGAPRTFAAAPPPGARVNPTGRYAAVVTVPAGGIASIAIGLEGYRYVDGQPPVRADAFFPIVNDPFTRGAAGTQAGHGTDVPWLLLVAVLVAGTAFGAARRGCRRTVGTASIR